MCGARLERLDRGDVIGGVDAAEATRRTEEENILLSVYEKK